MKSIYQELLERVEQGECFSINFESRNMKVGKYYLVKNGELAEGREIGLFSPDNLLMEVIECLYKEYKFSTPSERSDKRTGYFKALSVHELTDAQLICGSNREYARAKLEGYILCAVLSGFLKWNDNWGTYFWQSKEDPDLVILKQWIEGR